MKPHAHRWKEYPSKDRRRCLDCGEVQFGEGRAVNKLSDTPLTLPTVYASGGVYSAEVSASMKRVTDSFASTAKNMTALGEVASAASADYTAMLKRLGIKYDPGPWITGGRGEVSETAPPVKKWTSKDALTLILEEIKHDPDVFAAAGKWLTRFTNAVTDITRNLEDED